MDMMIRRSFAALAATMVLCVAPAGAQVSNDTVKIGLLEDFSGIYADDAGQGAAEGVKLAIEEFGGKVNGKTIEFVQADHQNKADIGIQIAKKWYTSENVDVIIGLTNSTVALAVQEVAREAQRLVMFSGAGAAVLTEKACSPYGLQWTYSTYAYTKGISQLLPQLGKSYFFITADYAFGHALESEMTALIKQGGGRVLGASRHPLRATDFSSFILQARASGADVVVLASAGNDLNNALKQLKEFGVTGKAKILPLIMDLRVIDAVGKDVAGGAIYIAPWYTELNPATQKLSADLGARMKRTPGPLQAGAYSAARTYLQAVQKAGTDAPLAVAKAIREGGPVNDGFATNGVLRADGSFVHDMYLLQVKSAAESRGPADRVKLVGVVKGADAFRPAGEGGCTLR
ncbi:MAG: transporter permease [Ramlibacter sp.]|nr:transporter permease [Ramlibacter sp.]